MTLHRQPQSHPKESGSRILTTRPPDEFLCRLRLRAAKLDEASRQILDQSLLVCIPRLIVIYEVPMKLVEFCLAFAGVAIIHHHNARKNAVFERVWPGPLLPLRRPRSR